MGLSQEDIDLIQDFIDNNPAVDKEQFQTKYAHDPAFKQEADLRIGIVASLKAHNKVELKKELTEIFEETKQDAGKPGSYLWYGVAATILLVVISTLVLTHQSKEEKLYTQYFYEYPGITVERGSNLEQDQPIVLYNMKKYEKVLEVLDSESYQSDTLTFIAACSHLNLGDFESSLARFDQIKDDSNFYLLARWYSALAYIRTNNTSKAIEILQELSKVSSLIQSDATNLLSALNEK